MTCPPGTPTIGHMNKEQILKLIKKHDPNFLPIDLYMEPWLKNLLEEAFDAGRTEGYEQGHESGYDKGYDRGYDRGYEVGRDSN